MDDVLGYAGLRVVVTGAASGMGRVTATLLGELGATVVGVDRAEVTDPVEQAVEVDLLDPTSIEAAVERIDGPVHAVFNCAGLPGPPFSELDTMLVNFVGGRELIEGLVPRMPDGSAVVYVASAAGVGWEDRLDALMPLVTSDGFEAARAWLGANEEAWSWSGYAVSKQAINAWTAWRSASLMKEHGIRLNCINPGPTDTAMMPAFHASAGKELVDMAQGPVGRYSTAQEQAWPMVMVNSPRASYVVGESLYTDGGFRGGLVTGTLEMSALAPPEG